MAFCLHIYFCFLDALVHIGDHYSNVYDSHTVIGEFSLEPSHLCLDASMKS